ncbi:MAG: CoA transferase [Novosphingobium sp.]|nr:CoA transferase [Novosphingobium sp.]
MAIAPLEGVKVAVYANGVAAAYAARLLGTLGAACTLVEGSEGSALRREAPFLPGGGCSALFAYLTVGMTPQQVDLSDADARRDLLGGIDIFIHDTALAKRAAIGLDEATLAQLHPGLIHVSTLPFGAVGPKAEWKGEEINVLHASGEGYLLPNGLTTELFPDRPPVKIYGHFTEMQGGTAAALGALAAFWAKPACGGQFVDISSQDAGLAVGAFAIQRLGDGSVEHRVERSFRFGGVIECQDGYVELLTLEQRQWEGLVDLLGTPDWARDPELNDSVARSRRGPEINGYIRAWARTRKVDDVVRDGQALSVRFRHVAHAGVSVPFRRRAIIATRKGPCMKPLAGIRIADFTVHNAGPFCTNLLSQLGAEVVKVESAMRPDAFRKPHPVYGREGPATFDQVASTKLSIRINLKKPDGVALAQRLVAISDIAAESFRAGVLARLGISYEALRAVKQDIILLSVSSCGQQGPDAHFAGYAPLFGAWGGLSDLTGFADGPPVEMRHVMDHTVGMHSAVAVMAALHRRRATGEGSHVDVAAREVASALCGEALLLAAAGGNPARMGNHVEGLGPHGVYPALGEDRWISIAVRSDAERAALAALVGSLSDTAISAWTCVREPNAAAAELQAVGVAAHASWTTPEIAADPHLRARGTIVEVSEPDGKQRAAVAAPMRLSGAPEIGIHRGTPQLGEDEDYVFGELLGLTRAERNQLEEAEIIH